MDLSDVGVRHAIRFTPLNIKHSIEVSPSVVSIFKEIRYCVFAVVIGFAATAITKSILASRHRPSTSEQS